MTGKCCKYNSFSVDSVQLSIRYNYACHEFGTSIASIASIASTACVQTQAQGSIPDPLTNSCSFL